MHAASTHIHPHSMYTRTHYVRPRKERTRKENEHEHFVSVIVDTTQ